MPGTIVWAIWFLFPAVFGRYLYASNGVEMTGVGSRARMRGGADVAVGDGPLSQIDNPATLSPRAAD